MSARSAAAVAHPARPLGTGPAAAGRVAGRRPLRLVPPLRTGAPRAPFVVLLGTLLTGGLAGLLFLHTALAEDSFRLHDLKVRSAVLTDREQALEQEVALEASPRRLAARAEAMGMVRSENPAFIRLSDGRVLGTPTPAVPEDGIRIAPLPTLKPKNLRPDPVIVPAPETAADDKAGDARSDRGRDGAASPAPGDEEGTKKQHDREGRSAGQQGSER